jgi:hypothetical protein
MKDSLTGLAESRKVPDFFLRRGIRWPLRSGLRGELRRANNHAHCSV